MLYLKNSKEIGEALEATGVLKDKILVDVGCGSGGLMQAVKDKGVTVKGIELYESAVAKCAEKGLDVTHADAGQVGVSLPVGDVYLLDVNDPAWMSNVLLKIPAGTTVIFGQYRVGSEAAKFVEAQVKLRPTKTTRKILVMSDGLEVLTIIER
ncbi:MAG: hypothetical protein JXD22_11705 [Sedimentisphaerales bacterium]|nr:hypothetical protein [Sedimentisphaerales bacterium]